MTYKKGIAVGQNDNFNKFPPWPPLKTIEQYWSFGMMPEKHQKHKPYYMDLYGDDIVVIDTPQ